MRPAHLIGWAAIVAMLAALAYASAHGDFRRDASAIAGNPWGVVTLVDVYVGFVLFSAWIAQRERRLLVAAVWIGALMLLGNLIAGAYVLAAASGARGDRTRFWLGDRGGGRDSGAI